MNEALQPAVLILAGGKGRRCGNRDKGWLEIAGEALVVRRLREFKDSGWPIAISANRTLERYRALGVPLFVDDSPDFSGPLAGVAAALAARFGNPLISVPVDVQRVSVDVLRKLVDASEDGCRPAFACDAEGPQPLVAVWPASALAAVAAAQCSADRSVRGLQRRLFAVAVEFPLDRFGNINTPAELASAGGYSPGVGAC